MVPEGILAEIGRLMRGKRYAALSGAGISTESGIPDYRGPGSENRRVKTIWYRDFVSDPEARRRYWARSAVGWPRMKAAVPNAGHAALARMERIGSILGVVTQNVDGLHAAAGSRNVVELHGSLSRVICLSCGGTEEREDFQGRLLDRNPSLIDAAAAYRPDGDAELPMETVSAVAVPPCLACGGDLKPDVVFFGERVPSGTVARAGEIVASSDGLLVLGTSLTVYSGFRFVRMAAEENLPVLIVTIGPTRGDVLATLVVEGRLGEVLPRICDALE